jgi:predicted esterase
MSQGGAMSLYYALSSPYLLGGAIALSSYLLPLTPLQNMGKIPLFLIHGDKDTTVH